MNATGWFDKLAKAIAKAAGRPSAFILALAVVIVWAVTGPYFDYEDNWQLVINTGTTIVTFLMVFLIQNAQNRDTAAMHLKLDELLRAVKGARNALIDLENVSEVEIESMQSSYQRLAKEAREKVQAGGRDGDCPDPELLADAKADLADAKAKIEQVANAKHVVK